MINWPLYSFIVYIYRNPHKPNDDSFNVMLKDAAPVERLVGELVLKQQQQV